MHLFKYHYLLPASFHPFVTRSLRGGPPHLHLLPFYGNKLHDVQVCNSVKLALDSLDTHIYNWGSPGHRATEASKLTPILPNTKMDLLSDRIVRCYLMWNENIMLLIKPTLLLCQNLCYSVVLICICHGTNMPRSLINHGCQ